MNSTDDIQQNNKFEGESTLDSKVEAVVGELASMSQMLRPDVQESTLRNSGALSSGESFNEHTYKQKLRQEISRQIEIFGIPKATMFICPRVDVRDMSNPSTLFPTKLSIDSIDGRRADIFVSRIPRIFQLFHRLAEYNSPFELVLVIGDSDFAPNIGYQWKAIEYAAQRGGEMGVFDVDTFVARTKSYQRYLAELLRTNSIQNDVSLFEVITNNAPITSQRTIRILSFYELYQLGVVPTSVDIDLNQLTLEEESASKLSHYREAVKKYDTNFFGRITPEEVRRITEGKFRSYRDQGLYVAQNHGKIVLSDELPPALKAEMYRNQLLILWPWIRKEDLERNPEAAYDKTYKVKLVEPAIEG